MLKFPVEWISRALNAIAGASIVVMLILVCSDVLSRMLFNIAIPGTNTVVASYLMVATIFLPLATLQLLEENISVEVISGLLPVPLQNLCDIIGHLLSGTFYVLLGYLYYHVAVEAIEIREFASGTWDVPIWPARVIMPLGLFIAALAAALKAILVLTHIFKKPENSHDHHGKSLR